jgi:GNAT superfamily N-acetyltransferase
MDNIHGDSAIIVREMDPSEKDATKALFKQLNPVERLMFVLIFNDIQKAAAKHAGCCLVAVTGGTIVGTISLHLKEIAGKKCGFIDALIADKTHRGQGISKMLIDRSLAWCEQNGCQNIFATADRYNSRSWNMFIHKGFSLYETTRQIQDFGAGFLKLWNAEGYYIGFGTFFLKKDVGDTKPKQTRSAFHFLAAWGWMTLVWWIISFQGGISFERLPAYLVIIGITL